MEACVYDGGKTDVIAVGKRYAHTRGPMTMRLLRLMVHRWADELVSHYTGDPGIAQTKIIYVSEDQAGRRDLFVMDYDGYGPKRVTSNPKLSLMPNWSPDRRSVVYTTYRRNNQEIVWLELGKGKRRILVPPETLNMTPTVSPNGRWLAYASAKDSAKQGEFRHLYDEHAHGKEKAINQSCECGIVAHVVAGWTRIGFYVRSDRSTANLHHEGRRLTRPPVDL